MIRLPSSAERLATGAVNALRPHPMFIALIVINLVFMGGGGWIVLNIAGKVSDSNSQRDKALIEAIRSCVNR